MCKDQRVGGPRCCGGGPTPAICGLGRVALRGVPDHHLSTALTFREEQCAAYNLRTDLFKNFPGPMDWVPRYAGVAPRDQCKLTCQAQALGYYYVLQPRVRAGTERCRDTLLLLPDLEH